MDLVLVTGGAGFIGSHLVAALLEKGYSVRVIDDLSSGRRPNLEPYLDHIEFIHGSITDEDALAKAFHRVDACLHFAAIPSVPRSIDNPGQSNRVNVEGSVDVFLAARSAGVRRLVFASSSAVYGNVAERAVVESLPRAPISPYGVTKAAGEMYAEVFSQLYGLDIVSLRYFNVFGPRQDPRSPYAAVIPIFLSHLFAQKPPPIHGDGRQSRDFTYIDNVVHANLLALKAPGGIAGAYNIACGESTAIVDLVAMLNQRLGLAIEPAFQRARNGDIRYSCADISKARAAFGYEPIVTVREGIGRTLEWFRQHEFV